MLCLTGCGEVSDTESTPKRVMDQVQDQSTGENDSKKQTTAVTTLQPLETFQRITALKKETDDEEKNEKDDVKASETNDWFSKHKLFDIGENDEQEEDFIETWYGFSVKETTYTTAVSKESKMSSAQSTSKTEIISESETNKNK